MVAGRNGARGGGARPSFRRSRCGFARIPLRFDAPAVVSREFRPLLACSGLFASPGPLRLRAATAHAVGRGLRFDAPAVVSREFPCVSTLPLWFRANSGLFWPALASSGLSWGGSHELLYLWSPRLSVIFRSLLGLFWPSSLFGVYAGIMV